MPHIDLFIPKRPLWHPCTCMLLFCPFGGGQSSGSHFAPSPAPPLPHPLAHLTARPSSASLFSGHTTPHPSTLVVQWDCVLFAVVDIHFVKWSRMKILFIGCASTRQKKHGLLVLFGVTVRWEKLLSGRPVSRFPHHGFICWVNI